MYTVSADIQTAIAALCREYRVKELLVFGSAARDDFRPEASDIDLLYVFQPGAEIGWFQLCDLQDKLAQLFQRKVDLVPKEGLNPLIRDSVLADAKPLYRDEAR